MKRPPLILVVPLAATVLVAGVALYLYLRSRPDHAMSGGFPSGPAALELDLGGGPARGRNSVPVLSPPTGPGEVTLTFQVPVDPGGLYEVEIQGPAEEPLLRSERGPLLLDDLGGAQVRVQTSRFGKSGTYRLVLREFAPGGGVREYRYPFRVSLPPSG